MNMKEATEASVGLLWVVVLVAAVCGWVMNIYAIWTGSFDPLTGIMVLRVIGIFIAPLGSILGYMG